MSPFGTTNSCYLCSNEDNDHSVILTWLHRLHKTEMSGPSPWTTLPILPCRRQWSSHNNTPRQVRRTSKYAHEKNNSDFAQNLLTNGSKWYTDIVLLKLISCHPVDMFTHCNAFLTCCLQIYGEPQSQNVNLNTQLTTHNKGCSLFSIEICTDKTVVRYQKVQWLFGEMDFYCFRFFFLVDLWNQIKRREF